MTSIALLNIGSELLRGRTINTNAATMAKLLGTCGYSLNETVVVHDEGPAITQAVNQLMRDHDVVLLTGGLGPTRDDITKKVLRERFGGEMVCHTPTLQQIEGFLLQKGREMLESNRQQAFVPSSCEVLFNSQGTAPGMAFSENGKTLISMPGVPFEMKHLMQEKVIPFLQTRYEAANVQTRIVRTAGIAESTIAERMQKIEGEIAPGISIAYLPSFDGTKIELRSAGEAGAEESATTAIDAAQMKVADLFSKYAYALEDRAPAELLAKLLLAEHISFCTAESCTGGAIAAALVGQSGISAVLKGGVIAYQREIKESVLGVPPATIDAHGIVSKEVAISMAEGARQFMRTDVAVSITGIAEAAPNASEKDAPQAWIGYADKGGSTAFHIRLHKKRQVNISIAKNAALIFALRQLQPPHLPST